MRTVFAAAFVGAAIATYLLRRRRRPLVLFDVDGTLAVPAQRAPDEIVRMLQQLRERGYLVGIVGAGDFEKQQGQLGGPNLLTRLDFCFSENGVHAFRGEQLLHCKSIVEQVGEERWREFEGIVDALLAEVRDEAESLLRKRAALNPGSRSAPPSSRGALHRQRLRCRQDARMSRRRERHLRPLTGRACASACARSWCGGVVRRRP